MLTQCTADTAYISSIGCNALQISYNKEWTAGLLEMYSTWNKQNIKVNVFYIPTGNIVNSNIDAVEI